MSRERVTLHGDRVPTSGSVVRDRCEGFVSVENRRKSGSRVNWEPFVGVFT